MRQLCWPYVCVACFGMSRNDISLDSSKNFEGSDTVMEISDVFVGSKILSKRN